MTIASRLSSAWAWIRGKSLRAGMDLTRTTHENKRHWADADALSGRAQTVKPQRKIARERSRLEAMNNSWYAGMLRTASNHIIGTGPRLQVLTADADVNQRIENAWHKWCDAVGLVEKLRICVETYWRDGEVFGMRALRPSLQPIGLDIRLYEGDQVSQPYWHVLDPTIEDGKRVDNLGNPVEYWIYDHHPGDLNIGHINILKGDWYPADRVFHLFRADRPGQLRGIPRCAPAIDWLAHMRRFSKATLSAAEAAALWGVFIKTTSSQVMPAETPGDFMSVDFERGTTNFLPEGWEPSQLRADHPATTNEMYQRSELTYFARCANMPYSLAAGTSRDSNFSSAKMDIKNTWEPEVKSEQSHIARNVLRPVFRWFLEDCVFVSGVLDDAPPISEIEYTFFWPPLPQSDELDVAKAAQLRMETGQSFITEEWAKNGRDAELGVQAAAAFFNKSVDEVKEALFKQIYGGKQPAMPGFGEQNAGLPAQNTPENAVSDVENDEEQGESDGENAPEMALEEEISGV